MSHNNSDNADQCAIRVSRVNMRYGAKEVLRDIDLDIPDGSYATLLGPSGSGKTTLLRIIAGFTAPSGGTIEIFGVDVTDQPARRRNIGMVFQNYALFPHLTAQENVGYPLRVRKMSRKEQAKLSLEYLERVQLADWAGHYPRELSGGQQQRVALARSLVYGPKLLMLDEPLGALDKHLRGDMQVFLKELQRDLGITFVHVTHDQSESLALSSLVVIIRDGGLEQVGSPEDIYLHPQSRFVAGFIGESNIVDCTIINRTGNFARIKMRDEVGFDLPLPEKTDSGVDSGQNALLVLRPENASMSMLNPTGSIRMTGQVLRTTFMGTHYEVIVETSFGKITANLERDYVRGRCVDLAWPLDKCILLPAR